MASFWYDSLGTCYKRENSGLGIVGTRRTLYIGNIEIVSENGTTTYKRYIGGALVQHVVNGIAANKYLFTDHIGSVVAATNEAGAVIEGGGFNAFGERRTNGSATSITTTGLASTTRGFTGHEMLDGLDVIHMNGRIYDPTLGRFLQADPVIQAPDNPQNWNAYTYVFNNPYRYTDPTGMIGQEERQWLGAMVAIAASIWTGGASLSWWGAGMTVGQAIAINVAAGFASGAISTQSMQGGLMGAYMSLANMATGGSVIAGALMGGVLSSLQGGSFGSGFLSAGLVAMAMPAIKINISGQVRQALVGALAGGTISQLTGGKFANGAVSGVLQVAMMESNPISSEHAFADEGGRGPGDGTAGAPEALKSRIRDPQQRQAVLEELSLGGYAGIGVITYMHGTSPSNVNAIAETTSSEVVFYEPSFTWDFNALMAVMHHENIHVWQNKLDGVIYKNRYGSPLRAGDRARVWAREAEAYKMTSETYFFKHSMEKFQNGIMSYYNSRVLPSLSSYCGMEDCSNAGVFRTH